MVKIPEQTKHYTKTFYPIDSRNLKDLYYDLKDQSKKHTWTLKLGFCWFNVNGGNSTLYYERLCNRYMPNQWIPKGANGGALVYSLSAQCADAYVSQCSSSSLP